MSSKLKIAAVIPARMGSSRFPGKPLIKVLDLPMIEHVRRRVATVPGLDHVIVATCDEEIRRVVEEAGGTVIMTSSKHERATDRIAEAVDAIDADIVLNIQGDEPMVLPKTIHDLIAPFNKNTDTMCSCIVYPLKDPKELESRNIVKCVLSNSGKILYLSRAGIPGHDVDMSFNYYKQSGFMAFRKDFLMKYTKLEPTPLEKKESVDILRILEHDLWVQGVISQNETKGIDTPEQVKDVEHAILSDPIQKSLYQKIIAK